ncbi:hypothetical protein KS4_30830 [Poriferisphaera corsica]|uniref:DUF2330 domain-containing protein n=1 Tax=Poriferisphaera corsica TaxID=2528020 RepID=A0A517YXQ8_9BACT|nr:DUF2330 domain-containing protein [Poriferisphaera corsica]QDU35006.1 hypothetical protein KS4_30830 [Poriferisphaera corsica]
MRHLITFMILVLISLCLSPQVVHADGKIFARPNFAKLPVPEQQAIIIYNDQTQTQSLIIQTHFITEKQPQDIPAEFTWVVPLPATPTITVADPNFFESLQIKTRPYVISESEITHYYIGIAFLTLFYIIGIYRYQALKRQHDSKAAARKVVFWNALFVCVCVFVLITIFLPALGAARRSLSVIPPNIDITSRQSVGPYNITTITSQTSAALIDYLNDNNYRIPSEAQPVIEKYVSQNWNFACITLKPQYKNQFAFSPTPLNFTFKTATPVYPLALTAVENEACAIDLYIFAHQKMSADGFQPQRAAAINFEPFENYGYFHDSHTTESEIQLFYPPYIDTIKQVLAQTRSSEDDHTFYVIAEDRAKPLVMLTKLSRTFQPGEMKDDAYLTNIIASPYLPKYHSTAAASIKAINLATLVFAIPFILILFIGDKPITTAKLKYILSLAIIAFAVYIVKYNSTDSIPSSSTRLHPFQLASEQRYFYSGLWQLLNSHDNEPQHLNHQLLQHVASQFQKSNVKTSIKPDTPPTLESVKQCVEEIIAHPIAHLVDYHQDLHADLDMLQLINPHHDPNSSSLPYRYGAVPAGYIINTDKDGHFQIVFFNQFAAPSQAYPLFESQKTP